VDGIELIVCLYFLRFRVGHAHLWRGAVWLTLIDTGAADA
jgi:hypothetical protein